MSQQIHVWSVPIKAMRRIAIPISMQLAIAEKLDFIPWIDKLFKLPSHTFVTISNDWLNPPSPGGKWGYWYCAGDFYPTDGELGLGEEITNCNVDFACCLVKPNIKLEDEAHSKKVIGGSYLVDFVCHNITNRVLYASPGMPTLADTKIPVTGYKAVVNSPLGIYGRQEREWHLIIDKCTRASLPPDDPRFNIPPDDIAFPYGPMRNKDDEITRIHLKAVNGDVAKAESITEKLYKIDKLYGQRSSEIYVLFENSHLSFEQFNTNMEILLHNTILHTESIVGEEITSKIYGDYDLSPPDTSDYGSSTGGLSGGNAIGIPEKAEEEQYQSNSNLGL